MGRKLSSFQVTFLLVARPASAVYRRQPCRLIFGGLWLLYFGARVEPGLIYFVVFLGSLNMKNDPSDVQRRNLLQIATGMAALGGLGLSPVNAATGNPAATGAAGDFDFLSGNWKIQHRQLKNKKWDLYESEATVYGILGGVASVEELRIPSRNFSGMGLRLLDIERKLWADYWVNSKSGVLGSAPAWGSFSNGVGIWDSADVDGD
jgi:hypothetical protein